MKGCLIFGAAIAAVLAAIFGVVWFNISRNSDVTHFNVSRDADIIKTDNRGTRSNVVYSYTYGGAKYYGKVWYYHHDWNPPGGFVVCLDPKKPAEHVTSLSGICGSSDLVADPQEAEKTQPSVGGAAVGGGLP